MTMKFKVIGKNVHGDTHVAINFQGLDLTPPAQAGLNLVVPLVQEADFPLGTAFAITLTKE
jgi:hypothetical protein